MYDKPSPSCLLRLRSKHTLCIIPNECLLCHTEGCYGRKENALITIAFILRTPFQSPFISKVSPISLRMAMK